VLLFQAEAHLEHGGCRTSFEHALPNWEQSCSPHWFVKLTAASGAGVHNHHHRMPGC
jgi:hypothetical protein